MNQPRLYTFLALTPIWTGDVAGKPHRVITTGLLGSVRWWFEVLVRGLGGQACDPSAVQKSCRDRKLCTVCEFFGCTGWARKFRFDVLDQHGDIQRTQIRASQKFDLRFTPLRAIHKEEWALLELTLRLIAKFGAIGGKTVLKPSEQNSADRHADYGLVHYQFQDLDSDREAINAYVHRAERRASSAIARPPWASCSNMWSVDGEYLTRFSADESSFNVAIGRPEPKTASKSEDGDSWLAGSQARSKKIFSFKNPPRTFGFINPAAETGERVQLEDIKQCLQAAWGRRLSEKQGDPDCIHLLAGSALLERIFSSSGGSI